MKLYFLPKTSLGTRSVGLIITMFALFALGKLFLLRIYTSVPAGDTILADSISRPGVAISMLAGFASGVSAFVTGLLAIIKHQERALLVFISTIIGALLMFFLIGEVIAPH